MRHSGDDGSEMPRPDFFDDAIDALLAGPPSAGESAALSAFVEEVRAAAGAAPTPSPVLAAAIAAGGISTHQPPVAKWRKLRMKLKGFLAGLGIAGKLALGAGVAAAATTGAGAAGVLPGSVQHAVSEAVGAVSPFSLPDGGHHESHDGNLADDTTSTTVGSHVTPTTVGGAHEPAKDTHENTDVVTPTTVAEHHDDSTGVTPTTVAEHHDDKVGAGTNDGSVDGNTGGTSGGDLNQGDGQKTGGDTTPPTTVHHEEHHNPEAISLSCTRSSEQVTITCTWSASPNADHDHYVVLRTHDGDPNGRAFFPGAGALSYTDTMVTAGGAGYSYLVDSLRADGSVSAHSNRVTVYCCGDAPATTTTISGDH